MTQSLSLLENAADSFNEALRKVRDASYGDARPYKFAVLHFTHAIELLFKHHVALNHPLLIYKNPFTTKKLDKELTIGMWDAVQFFKNEQKELTQEMLDDLKWIKELRNNIEHHKFEMDLPEARRTIGRLIRALNEFHEANNFTDLSSLIEQDCNETFEKLSDEYRQRLSDAQGAAKAAAGDQDVVVTCYTCGSLNTMVNYTETVECFMCSHKGEKYMCTNCSNLFPDYFMRVWNAEVDTSDLICDFCHDEIYQLQ